MTKVLVPLADGCEEMEAVIIIDTLRRAGWEVTAAAIGGQTVTASRRVRLVSDTLWEQIQLATFDVLALPGGAEGTRNLMADGRVLEAIRLFARTGKYVAAVCAGPLVLQAAGILDGRKATCHPGVKADLKTPERIDARVVTDGKIVTSQGPGTSFDFALELIRLIDGQTAADKVRQGLIL